MSRLSIFSQVPRECHKANLDSLQKIFQNDWGLWHFTIDQPNWLKQIKNKYGVTVCQHSFKRLEQPTKSKKNLIPNKSSQKTTELQFELSSEQNSFYEYARHFDIEYRDSLVVADNSYRQSRPTKRSDDS